MISCSATLKAMGVSVFERVPKYHALRLSAPLDQLEAIASLTQVRFISPRQQFMTNQADDAEFARGTPGSLTFQSKTSRAAMVRQALQEAGIGAQTNVLPNGYDGIGSANAEAVIAHGVYSARGTFNTTGLGIRIGVLSNGVHHGDQPGHWGTYPTCSRCATTTM